MSRGNPSIGLVLGRPTLGDLSVLYDGWLCRTVAINTSVQRTPTSAGCCAPQPDAPPEFIWASHPS